ncbi:MAG: succinate dehydrogenase assembly factor 2 [Hyphomicrobiaceae bacterium]|nr:succinate dehydrogenase assembly factor 2 [Hyphomicrobiaceae bacterium]
MAIDSDNNRQLSSAGLSERKRRILFRAWHRGTKELDIMIGSYADAHLAAMGEADLDAFEALMQQEEPHLYNWIAGIEDAPDAVRSPLLDDIIAFHKLRAAN